MVSLRPSVHLASIPCFVVVVVVVVCLSPSRLCLPTGRRQVVVCSTSSMTRRSTTKCRRSTQVRQPSNTLRFLFPSCCLHQPTQPSTHACVTLHAHSARVHVHVRAITNNCTRVDVLRQLQARFQELQATVWWSGGDATFYSREVCADVNSNGGFVTPYREHPEWPPAAVLAPSLSSSSSAVALSRRSFTEN